jgi:hypothetical protein
MIARMKAILLKILALLLSSSALPSRGQANTLIFPRGAAQSFGNISGFAGSSPQFQQIYRSSEFENTGAQIIDILGFAYRTDEKHTNSETGIVGLNASFSLGTSASPARDMYENLPHPVPVFAAERLTAAITSVRTPSDFNVHMDFPKAFRFNRALGDLVLQGSFSWGGVGIDAASSITDTGYILWYGPSFPCCETRFAELVLVTQFRYLVPTVVLDITASIDSLMLSVQSEGAELQLHEAFDVTGPFSKVPVTFERRDKHCFKVILDIPERRRFWRILRQSDQ